MIPENDILKAKILIIDDQEVSIHLLEQILQKNGYKNVMSTPDPREGVELYKQIRPDCLILDLNMPHLDGFQVMAKLSKIEGETYLPIIVLSTEENQEVRFLALESGAKDFVNKPFDRVEVLIRIKNLLEVRMMHNEIRDQNKILEDKVKERTQELYNTQLDVIQRLARAVEYRDSETGLHIVRMSHYSACLSAEAGLSMEECELVLTASPLHDIGKIGIPDSILRKPGKLTPAEWGVMKTHTTIGAELLSGSNSRFLKMASEIAIAHHEKWNGTGYPYGLKEDEIPVIGQICGLCDVFDALMSKRPYKQAWSLERTLEEIKNGSGTHFNPKMVDSFMRILPQILNIKDKYVDPKEDENGE